MKPQRTILVTIGCLSFIFYSFCQNSFEVLISTPHYERIADAEEDQNGNFYFVGNKAELYSPQDCAWFLKIDPSGNILKDKVICIQDSTIHVNIIKILNDTIYIFGSKGPLATGNRDILWILKTDFDFNIIQNKSFRTYENFHYQGPNSMVIRNEHFILLGNSVPDSNSQLPDICFYELDEYLDSIIYSIDIREFNQVGVDLLYDPISKNYKVFGHGNYPNTFSGYDELIKFDTSFNFLGVDSIAWQIYLQLSSKQFNDSSYFVTGNKILYGSQINKNIGIIKLNYNDDLLNAFQFGKGYDTADHAGINNNVDFTNKNSIYCGGTSNFIVNQWPWQTDNSWIMLVNLDSNLNLKWQRFYGGDAFYQFWGLKATQDGGCLMYAVRYDENTQFEEYDVYILKVDTNGLLTSTIEPPKIPVNELIFYPNPARDRVIVHYPDIFKYQDREVIFWNALGTEVRRLYRPTGQAEEPINISGLPPGLYIALLQSEGERIATGKFVVK